MMSYAITRARWLLLSDIHFKHHDLDRVRQTGEWIVDTAQRYHVNRAIVCGDLLTSRTAQQMHVLSACYRFIGSLIDVVPRVHILLGNHDLAYRRDYQTTALDALNIRRLSPHVSVHGTIAHHEWDGRQVLLLPFREEQNVLVEAVRALKCDEASSTVAFAHLAINKAITQRHVVRAECQGRADRHPITYNGLTGPEHFSRLARTFTGHFHSHQTIFNRRSNGGDPDPGGSITYLGSPLQLGWADLHDERRGIVLLDPDTLEHQLMTNPHAVSHKTVDVDQVLETQLHDNAVIGNHVMLVGELNRFKYSGARDRLLAMGVRSVRNWTPPGAAFNADRVPSSVLGNTVTESDAVVQAFDDCLEREEGSDTHSASLSSTTDLGIELPPQRDDLVSETRHYVESLELDDLLHSNKDKLVQVGQRIAQACHGICDEENGVDLNYKDILSGATQDYHTLISRNRAQVFTNVFLGKPVRLRMTNFLGVQATVTINFQTDFHNGLIIVVGENGSGKSTIAEAMTWCQFGRCLRSGMMANDFINDRVGKNCCVELEFDNGYTVSRYRKHQVYKNRVIVTLRGVEQIRLEHPDAHTTQSAINELLGTDYETYVKTVILSHESAASFLNSTPTQRRDLVESSLGLSVLDGCEQLSKQYLKSIDTDINHMRLAIQDQAARIRELQERCHTLDGEEENLRDEGEQLAIVLQTTMEKYGRKDPQPLDPERSLQAQLSSIQTEINAERNELRHLEGVVASLQNRIDSQSSTWLGMLKERLQSSFRSADRSSAVGLVIYFQFWWRSGLKLLLRLTTSLLQFRGSQSSNSIQGSLMSIDPETEFCKVHQEIAKKSDHVRYLENEGQKAKDLIIAINHQIEQALQVQATYEAMQLDNIRQQITAKQHRIVLHKQLIDTEQESLGSLEGSHVELNERLRDLAVNREILAFWATAFAKRPRRLSSSSSSSSSSSNSHHQTTKANPANFREYVLAQSLSELNVHLAQVLSILYEDTRHAYSANGVLRSLFEQDKASGDSLLDPSLSVNASFNYGKRSGGERKRMDIALFFALLQLARARSAHRALHVLVDEVFDNLDKAGQAAVVKWFSVMSKTTVVWAIVITHSQFMAEPDVTGDLGRSVVVTARMGQQGTELFVDGRKVGSK